MKTEGQAIREAWEEWLRADSLKAGGAQVDSRFAQLVYGTLVLGVGQVPRITEEIVRMGSPFNGR